MRTEYDIIKYPLITEKLTMLKEQNDDRVVGFIVDRNANKVEIKKAVEKIFNVKVEKVRTMNMKKRKKRYGRYMGEVAGFKKAIVTLEKGHKIDFLE